MINYVFAIGRRCNSTRFLREYNLSKVPSPFDWLFIDFETSCKNIRDNLEDYMSDIVIYHQKKDKKELIYPKNYHSTSSFFNELDKHEIGYMTGHYVNTELNINQNYLPNNIDGDIYNWDRICVFLHHRPSKKEGYKVIKDRVEAFNYVYNNYPKGTLLFYISEIIKNPEEQIEHYFEIMQKYDIKCEVMTILCTEGFDGIELREKGNLHSIIFGVPSYNKQKRLGNDNDLARIDYSGVYEIMRNNFKFDLLEKPEEMEKNGK